jgi:hypothetical protein
MALIVPTNRTAGEFIEPDDWNQDIVANITFLANPPACRVYNNANISISDISLTTVTFNSERYDTASMHSTSSLTSRITIPVAGLYLVTFNGHFVARNDYFQIYADLRLNGTTTIATHNIGSFNGISMSPDIQVHTVYKFAANDYVEARIYQDNNAGAAANLETQANFSPELSATWLGLG